MIRVVAHVTGGSDARATAIEIELGERDAPDAVPHLVAALRAEIERACSDFRSGEFGQVPRQARLRHRDLAEQNGRTVRLSDYPDTFPARRRPRRLIAVAVLFQAGKASPALIAAAARRQERAAARIMEAAGAHHG